MTRRVWIVAWIAVMGFTLACSLGGLLGSGASPTGGTEGVGVVDSGAANETGSLSDQPVVPEPEEPPQDFMKVLNERVANGEFDEGDALVAALQPLAGVSPDLDLFAGQDVTFFEATSLLEQADRYLEEGKDETSKQRLRDLVDRIFPPLENLERYSQPEGATSESGSSGFALIGNRRQDEAACRELSAEGFPPDDPASLICLLYSDFTVAGHRYRVYYPEVKASDPTYMTYVQAAEDAVRDSIDAFATMSAVDDATVVFTIEPSPLVGAMETPRAVTHTTAMVSSTHCPVDIFPSAFMESVDDFKQIVAHEMFHCLHTWRNGPVHFSGYQWYGEGMANYFSNVVYPNINMEHRFQGRFDYNSLDSTIFEMTYENMTFFQYLGNIWGDSMVFGLVDVLDPVADPAGWASALVSYGLDQDEWHRFGQQYLEKQIADTGGGTLPITLLYRQVHNVDGPIHIDLDSEPFLLARYLLHYRQNTEFDIATNETGLSGRYSAQQWQEGGSWGPLPPTFRSPCGRFGHVVLFTVATGGTGNATLVLDIDARDTQPCDSCLIGTWEQEPAEVERILRQIASGVGTVSGVSGGRYLLISGISEDQPGQMSLFARDACATIETEDGPVTGCISGSSVGHYATPEENVLEISDPETEMALVMTVPEGSVTIPVPGADPFGGPSRWTYECSESSLTVHTGGVAPFDTSTYTRTSPVATPTPLPAPEVAEPPAGGAPIDLPPGGEPMSPMCFQVEFSDFSVADGQATWRLHNGSPESMTISSISVNWPTANGGLSEIHSGASTMWDVGAGSPPAIINEGWLDAETLRQLPTGGDLELSAGFTGGEPAADGYLLVVDFTNGCLISDVR
ncbi:MAG: hypothetical protein WBR18_14635 [Anaerolineales bacterium]